MMCERRLGRGRGRGRWIFWRRVLDGRNIISNGKEWVLRGGEGCNGKYHEGDFLELNRGIVLYAIMRGVLVSSCMNVIRKGMMGRIKVAMRRLSKQIYIWCNHLCFPTHTLPTTTQAHTPSMPSPTTRPHFHYIHPTHVHEQNICSKHPITNTQFK